MTRTAPSQRGHRHQELAADPTGRFSGILRDRGDPWVAASLPLVFLAGLVFEIFLTLRDQVSAEITLNVVTVIGALGWLGWQLFQARKHPVDWLMQSGVLILLFGAGGRLFSMFPSLWPELLLKTIGTVLILLALDRAERRRAHRALRETARLLESVFESIPDPVFLLESGGRVLEANREARVLFGDEVIGRCCAEIDGEGTFRRPIEATLDEVRATGTPRFEQVRDATGQRRFEVTTFPLLGRDTGPSRLMQQWRDVRTAAAVEEHAGLLRDAIDSVRDPVLVLGLDGELRYRNRAAEELCGVEPVGAEPPLAEELLPFDRDEDRETFLISLRDWGHWQREVKLLGPGERVRIVDLSLSPIRASDERRLGSVVLVRDVTELKSLELQLVQNEKLGSLGQLVSGVAHELNNPLTAVFGFAQLLLGDDLPEKTRVEVQHIYTHSERCKKIIDGLLKFSRPHQGEKTRTNLNDVVSAAVDLVRHPLKLAEVEVDVELAPSLPDSMMDSFLLQQVLINLLTNAQHAIESRGVAGLVRVRTFVGRSGHLVVELSDNGCGIPRSEETRIFDPFFTTKGIGEGTGLGLSLSYGIVKDHGGTMNVRSQVGQGTTFQIEFPVVMPPSKTPPVAASAPRPSSASRRLLIVDDEPVILELMGEILVGDGHSVVVAASGPEALARARDERFDAVFSDWRMPGMNGDELYQCLVEVDVHYRGRVIFTTGDTLDRSVARLAAQDGNQLLKKPFTIEAVQARLQSVGPPVEAAARGTQGLQISDSNG